MNRMLAMFALMTMATPLDAKPRPPIEHIGQPTLRGARLPFSEAVRVGDLLFLSGQVGLRPDGTLAPGFDAQAHQAMANIGGVLAKAKLGWAFGADGLALGALLEVECIAHARAK